MIYGVRIYDTKVFNTRALDILSLVDLDGFFYENITYIHREKHWNSWRWSMNATREYIAADNRSMADRYMLRRLEAAKRIDNRYVLFGGKDDLHSQV